MSPLPDPDWVAEAAELRPGALYVVRARNFQLALHEGGGLFHGLREKFGTVYVDLEAAGMSVMPGFRWLADVPEAAAMNPEQVSAMLYGVAAGRLPDGTHLAARRYRLGDHSPTPYHVAGPLGELTAACRAKLWLDYPTARRAERVPPGLRCGRAGCAARWPA